MNQKTKDRITMIENGIMTMSIKRDALRARKEIDYPDGHAPFSVLGKIGGCTNRIKNLKAKIEALRGVK